MKEGIARLTAACVKGDEPSPEEARRILREEMPERIERLRNEFRELKEYLCRTHATEHWDEKAA